MDMSPNSHIADHKPVSVWAFYNGIDALMEGEGLCYNTDYGTATAADRRRNNIVERPSASNNNAFAGVAARTYSAVTGGQFVELYAPGSRGVNVALLIDTVIDTGIVTCLAGPSGSHRGRFAFAGFPGRGSAIPRQTKTAALLRSVAGAASLATDGITLTVSSTTGFAVGDTVAILGGELESVTKAINPGKYTILSITSATVLVLSSSAVVATPDAAVTCSVVVYTGNPVCQCDLMEGPESGLVELVSFLNAGHAADATFTIMKGGVTYIGGGITIGTGNARAVLADGDWLGQKKGFYCQGTETTNDAEIELATAGIQQKVLDAIDTGAQGDPLALARASFDAAAERLYLEWQTAWVEIFHSGCVLATT